MAIWANAYRGYTSQAFVYSKVIITQVTITQIGLFLDIVYFPFQVSVTHLGLNLTIFFLSPHTMIATKLPLP